MTSYRPLIILGIALAAIAAVWGYGAWQRGAGYRDGEAAKAAEFTGAIDKANRERDAEKARADNLADAQRTRDTARVTTEEAELRETVDEARATGGDPRRAYYDCLRTQQAARARGSAAPPDC